MRYAHTLLFVCPDCNLPIAVSRISYHQNLEVESMLVRIRCDYCLNGFEVRAFTAKTHWVTEWQASAEPAKRAAAR
jgi:hypothetical protein